jgi:hypothetical protein
MLKASIIYLLVFSFLLAGCYTTDNYSDTPRNIFSGKSKIELNDDFVLDSLTLKSNINLKLQNYFTQFIECSKDTCGKFIYRSLIPVIDTAKMLSEKSRTLLYKKNPTDTIAVSGISKMFYNKKHFDWGWMAFYTIVSIGFILIFSPLIIKAIFPHGVG